LIARIFARTSRALGLARMLTDDLSAMAFLESLTLYSDGN